MAFRRYSRGEVCPTCADRAVAVRVLNVHGKDARVEDDVRTYDVAVDLIENVRVGDTLLIHAGVAIARVETL